MANVKKEDVIVLPSSADMLETMIVIDSHNFDDNKNKLQAFSDDIPKLENLPTVAESGGLFGLFGHNVKGEELNNLTEQIQNRMIKQNECIVKIIGEFNTVYKTFETLNTDYIRKITDALSSAREANRKAVISIDGLEKNQGDINKLISQQGQIIKVLSNFKTEIEKIKHIAEVDNIFDDVIAVQNEAEQISKLLESSSSEINTLKINLSSTLEEQSGIKTKIDDLDERQNCFEEEIKHLTIVDEQIANDVSTFKKESFDIAGKIDKKVSENKILINKTKDHFESKLTAVFEKIAQQKSEILEEVDATKKLIEATMNANVNTLVDEIHKELYEQKENMNEFDAIVTANKEETNNSLLLLKNHNVSQDNIIGSLKKEIEEERTKTEELTVNLTKLMKFFKLFGIVSGSGILVLLILIVLIISGVL